MKYKVGDKVTLTNGNTMTIDQIDDISKWYRMKEDPWNCYTDEMIEGLVEEEKLLCEGCCSLELKYNKLTIADNICTDKVEIILQDYELKKEGDKWFAVKKKKEYPKTYEECCEVLMGKTDFQDFELVLTKFSTNRSEENSISPEPPHISLINAFYKLLICRDAYWKLYGEEMGLGKPWKPNDSSGYCTYAISHHTGHIRKSRLYADSELLEFPTEEMRDDFEENFDPDIEFCKELL